MQRTSSGHKALRALPPPPQGRMGALEVPPWAPDQAKAGGLMPTVMPPTALARTPERLNPWSVGSPGRTRTSDPAVNSRLLYQLSYRGPERARRR